MSNPYDNQDGISSTTGDSPYDDVLEESGGEIYSKQDEQDDRLDDLETDMSSAQTSITTNETDIDALETRMDTAEDDIDDQEAIHTAMSEPTGFNRGVSATMGTMSFVEATRTFNLSVTGGQTYFSFWISGIEYRKTATESITIADVEGMHYIYFDTSGDIQEAVNPTDGTIDTAIRDYALVAVIYWDATNSKAVYYGEERHGITMDGNTHSYLHFRNGLAYISGLAPTDVLTDEDGSSNTHAQVGISSGSVSDEDIYLSISAIVSTTGYRVLYKDGASANWRYEDVTGYPFINAIDRAYWNEYTAGAWTRTEVTDGDFVLIHLFASTSVNNPVFVIMGENKYSNKRTAREGANTEMENLFLGDLPTPEITRIATLILQCKTSYSNDVNARFVTTDGGDDYIDWRDQRGIGSGATTASHSNLSNLDNDDHTQYSLISSGSGAPSSTPSRVGEIYIDTTGGGIYISSGIVDSSDWDILGTGSSIPIGTSTPFSGVDIPSGFLLEDGSAISRSTYSSLYDVITDSKGTVTITEANPGVVTLSTHGFVTGDNIELTTTGTLPTNLTANTNYYVYYVDANSFQLATTRANAIVGITIDTSGAVQTGIHTLRYTPWGISTSANFLLPDRRGSFTRFTGDHGSETMADGNPFSGKTLGQPEDDAMQKITGSTIYSLETNRAIVASATGVVQVSGSAYQQGYYAGTNANPTYNQTTFDNSNSTSPNPARTNDAETKPFSIPAKSIIKYR